MPRLADVSEYQAYLHDVPAGKLVLPPPTKKKFVAPEDPDDPCEQPESERTHESYIVELGEKSCSSAANLRKHLKTHDVYVAPGNDGKISTVAWVDAIKFYRSLFPHGVVKRKGQWTGVYPDDPATPSRAGAQNLDPASPSPTAPTGTQGFVPVATKLELPRLSSGEYDLLTMRRIARQQFNIHVPCPPCRKNKHPKGCGNSDECHVRQIFEEEGLEEDGEGDENEGDK